MWSIIAWATDGAAADPRPSPDIVNPSASPRLESNQCDTTLENGIAAVPAPTSPRKRKIA
jgi:hypothetical protein